MAIRYLRLVREAEPYSGMGKTVCHTKVRTLSQ